VACSLVAGTSEEDQEVGQVHYEARTTRIGEDSRPSGEGGGRLRSERRWEPASAKRRVLRQKEGRRASCRGGETESPLAEKDKTPGAAGEGVNPAAGGAGRGKAKKWGKGRGWRTTELIRERGALPILSPCDRSRHPGRGTRIGKRRASQDRRSTGSREARPCIEEYHIYELGGGGGREERALRERRGRMLGEGRKQTWRGLLSGINNFSLGKRKRMFLIEGLQASPGGLGKRLGRPGLLSYEAILEGPHAWNASPDHGEKRSAIEKGAGEEKTWEPGKLFEATRNDRRSTANRTTFLH